MNYISKWDSRKWNWTGSKKKLNCLSVREKTMILEKDEGISIKRQCELLEISRSTAYYKPSVNESDLKMMHAIDEIYTEKPFYGKRRIRNELWQRGFRVGVKKVKSLMKKMGLEAIYPKPRTSISHPEHKKYPYLLRDVIINRNNQVWSTDITYIKLKKGFVYLVAIIDWYSRYVISWKLSLTLEKDFCIEALEEALSRDSPEIFNSDQGVQFTSLDFTSKLEEKNIQISMDGKGRCLDNIFIERFWRSLKYEDIFIKNYESPLEVQEGIKKYIHFYNHSRPHQSLNYKTPAQIYLQKTTLTP